MLGDIRNIAFPGIIKATELLLLRLSTTFSLIFIVLKWLIV